MSGNRQAPKGLPTSRNARATERREAEVFRVEGTSGAVSRADVRAEVWEAALKRKPALGWVKSRWAGSSKEGSFPHDRELQSFQSAASIQPTTWGVWTD